MGISAPVFNFTVFVGAIFEFEDIVEGVDLEPLYPAQAQLLYLSEVPPDVCMVIGYNVSGSPVERIVTPLTAHG